MRAALLLLVAGASPANAVDPGRALTQYTLDTFAVEEGLPQSSARALAETPDGYLWIGTEEGLARYDGARFAVFDGGNTPELSPQLVSALGVDRGGRLWVGTGAGLLLHAHGRFSRPAQPPRLAQGHLRFVVETRDGTLWAGTLDHGLFRQRGEGWVEVPGVARPRALAEGPGGELLLATSGQGLLRLGASGPEPVAGAELEPYQQSLLFAADGALWVGQRRGLSRRTPEGLWLHDSREGRFPGDNVSALYEDRHGQVWIGTAGGGLHRFRAGRFEALRATDGLASDRVEAIREDTAGDLWVGTPDAGLVRLKAAPMIPLGRRQGLTSEHTLAVLEGAGGQLWVGTDGGGVLLLPGGRGQESLPPIRTWSMDQGLPSADVPALFFDHATRLWAGTTRGLAVLEGERFRPLPGFDGLVLAGLPGPEDSLWLATVPRGLVRVREEKVQDFLAESWATSALHTLLVEDDALYFGCRRGLCRRRAGRVELLVEHPALDGESLYCFHRAQDGALWLGTAGHGLFRWSEGELRRVGRAQGLPSELVYRILPDGQGRLWMSGNRGLFRVAEEELTAAARGDRPTVHADSYGRAHGMPSLECAGGTWPPGQRSNDGRLWFPTTRGLVVFDPAAVDRAADPPRTVLEELRVDALPGVSPGPRVRLPAATRHLELSYTAPAPGGAEGLRFRYRLLGLDERWSEVGPRRTAYLMNLPPRELIFEVSAAAGSGPFGPPAKVHLLREPALLETWWARALLTLVLAAALAVAYALRVRGLAARRHRLERLVEERTLDLRDKNQRLEVRTQELDQALRSLRSTQAELVRAEQIAGVATIAQGIAHELNNPIGFLTGNVEFLRRYCGYLERVARTLADGRARGEEEVQGLLAYGRGKSLEHVSADLEALLADMSEGARRARLIISDLQSLTTGTQRGLVEVDVAQALRQSLRLLSAKLHRRREVQLELGTTAPLVARAGAIEQIAVNLLENAALATGPEGVILLSARDAGGELLLQVADDGCGMDQETRRRALEPFFTTRAVGEGSGLGLAIVASIVQAHGGRVEIESAPERGTRVTVALPRRS